MAAETRKNGLATVNRLKIKISTKPTHTMLNKTMKIFIGFIDDRNDWTFILVISSAFFLLNCRFSSSFLSYDFQRLIISVSSICIQFIPIVTGMKIFVLKGS